MVKIRGDKAEWYSLRWPRWYEVLEFTIIYVSIPAAILILVYVAVVA